MQGDMRLGVQASWRYSLEPTHPTETQAWQHGCKQEIDVGMVNMMMLVAAAATLAIGVIGQAVKVAD